MMGSVVLISEIDAIIMSEEFQCSSKDELMRLFSELQETNRKTTEALRELNDTFFGRRIL